MKAKNFLENLTPGPAFKPNIVLNDINELAEDRKAEMQTYAEKLRKKYPTWKDTRIGRKTAEYFNIKLV